MEGAEAGPVSTVPRHRKKRNPQLTGPRATRGSEDRATKLEYPQAIIAERRVFLEPQQVHFARRRAITQYALDSFLVTCSPQASDRGCPQASLCDVPHISIYQRLAIPLSSL